MDDSEDDEEMIFSKAQEFLQLARRTTKPNTCAEVNVLPVPIVDAQFNEATKKHPKFETQSGGIIGGEKIGGESLKVTRHKRRKLERIKAPVTLFVKQSKQTTGTSFIFCLQKGQNQLSYIFISGLNYSLEYLND
jgi:hypothetical protein